MQGASSRPSHGSKLPVHCAIRSAGFPRGLLRTLPVRVLAMRHCEWHDNDHSFPCRQFFVRLRSASSDRQCRLAFFPVLSDITMRLHHTAAILTVRLRAMSAHLQSNRKASVSLSRVSPVCARTRVRVCAPLSLAANWFVADSGLQLQTHSDALSTPPPQSAAVPVPPQPKTIPRGAPLFCACSLSIGLARLPLHHT